MTTFWTRHWSVSREINTYGCLKWAGIIIWNICESSIVYRGG